MDGDRGHRPRSDAESPLGLGLLAHGFQSPIETTPFIIADGPDFADGYINNTYSQVDITPTILRLFGLGSEPYFAGEPLMDKAASDYQPAIPGQAALKNALNDAIGMYGYPNIATNLRLSWRTIVATVPYTVYTLSTAIADKVPSVLSKPVLFVGAVIYQMVNIPAQLIVRLTGASRATRSSRRSGGRTTRCRELSRFPPHRCTKPGWFRRRQLQSEPTGGPLKPLRAHPNLAVVDA